MSKKKKISLEICYNCNKKETIKQGFSYFTKVEIEIENCSDDEETFMPLCSNCYGKWARDELKKIEKKWQNEKNKDHYSSTIGWEGDYDENQDEYNNIQKKSDNKMKLIQFDTKKELKKFMESNNPIAKLAELESVNYPDQCDQCTKYYEIIISGGKSNYYLCSKHANQLKEIIRKNH